MIVFLGGNREVGGGGVAQQQAPRIQNRKICPIQTPAALTGLILFKDLVPPAAKGRPGRRQEGCNEEKNRDKYKTKKLI